MLDMVDDAGQVRLPNRLERSVIKTSRLTDCTVCCLRSIPVVRRESPELVDDIFMRDISERWRREGSWCR